MMDELNIVFNDYIDAYKDLDIAEKRKGGKKRNVNRITSD